MSIVGAILMVIGLVFYAIQFVGVFHYKYVLNRIHAAAIGDTLGSGAILAGAMLMYGISMPTLKIAVIAIFLWFTAPVSSHMLARMEVYSKKSMDEVAATVIDADDIPEEFFDEERAEK